jgi:uncharacterized protein (DUF486 family)
MNTFLSTTALLVVSNTFMTVAWYWHLKHKDFALWKVILISWALAGVEYCFAVPANRLGAQGGLSGGQLKILQEAITLVVFTVFMVTFLGEPLKWQYGVGVGLVLAGVFVIYCL